MKYKEKFFFERNSLPKGISRYPPLWRAVDHWKHHLNSVSFQPQGQSTWLLCSSYISLQPAQLSNQHRSHPFLYVSWCKLHQEKLVCPIPQPKMVKKKAKVNDTDCLTFMKGAKTAYHFIFDLLEKLLASVVLVWTKSVPFRQTSHWCSFTFFFRCRSVPIRCHFFPQSIMDPVWLLSFPPTNANHVFYT